MSIEYKIIEPPPIDGQKLEDLSREELETYKQWFLNSMPRRIRVLENAVRATKGFEDWKADLTRESLLDLGKWFKDSVKARRRSAEELEIIRRRSIFRTPLDEYDLTDQTLSIAIDVGMYLAQLYLREYPSLHLSQRLGRKDSIDFGHVVVDGFPKISFNPMRMMNVHAWSLLDGSRSADDLLWVYMTRAKLMESSTNQERSDS